MKVSVIANFNAVPTGFRKYHMFSSNVKNNSFTTGVSEALRISTFLTSPAALTAALGVKAECLWLTDVRVLSTHHEVRRPVKNQQGDSSYVFDKEVRPPRRGGPSEFT